MVLDGMCFLVILAGTSATLLLAPKLEYHLARYRNFRRYRSLIISVGFVALVTLGYTWQARTTYVDDLNLCYHAHFEEHTRSAGPGYDDYGELIPRPSWSGGTARDWTFIRHYHKYTELGYCSYGWPHQNWKAYSGAPTYEVRKNSPSDRWPKEPGNYIFVRHTDSRLVPVYAGSSDNLKESLSNPDLHERADCIRKEGATHIHAALSHGNVSRREDRHAYFVHVFAPPCNEGPKPEYRMGTGLVEGHVVSWDGKSGKDYTYRNDGDYADEPGNYVFAKYEKKGTAPNRQGQPESGWLLLYAGESST